MKLERVTDIGRTPYGNRQVAVVQDGVLSGSRFSGSVMTGALDLELKLSNGVIEIEQLLVLKSNDGRYIYVRAAGTGAERPMRRRLTRTRAACTAVMRFMDLTSWLMPQLSLSLRPNECEHTRDDGSMSV